MRKKICLLLTLIISLFVFSDRAEADDEDLNKWLGKCVYEYKYAPNGRNIKTSKELIVYFNDTDVKIECDSCYYDGISKNLSEEEYTSYHQATYFGVLGGENYNCGIKVFSASVILQYYNLNVCPAKIYVGVNHLDTSEISDVLGINTFISALLGSTGCNTEYKLDDKWGTTSILFDKNVATYKDKEFFVKPNVEQKPTDIEVTSCSDLFGTELVDDINKVMDIIKIVIPILLIVLGVIDFTKAVFSGSEDDISKCKKVFLKRIVAAVLVFLVPVFINLILNVANGVWSNISTDTCIK